MALNTEVDRITKEKAGATDENYKSVEDLELLIRLV